MNFVQLNLRMRNRYAWLKNAINSVSTKIWTRLRCGYVIVRREKSALSIIKSFPYQGVFTRCHGTSGAVGVHNDYFRGTRPFYNKSIRLSQRLRAVVCTTVVKSFEGEGDHSYFIMRGGHIPFWQCVKFENNIKLHTSHKLCHKKNHAHNALAATVIESPLLNDGSFN